MKLDRNTNPDGRGKYALLLLRNLAAASPSVKREIEDAFKVLSEHGLLDFGDQPGQQFFVIRHKDKFAAKAFYAYAEAVHLEADAAPHSDTARSLYEYASEIRALGYDSEMMAGRQIPD